MGIPIFLPLRRIQTVLTTRARVEHQSAQSALQRLMGRRNDIGHTTAGPSTRIGSQRDTAIRMVAVTATNLQQTQQMSQKGFIFQQGPPSYSSMPTASVSGDWSIFIRLHIPSHCRPVRPVNALLNRCTLACIRERASFLYPVGQSGRSMAYWLNACG